MNKKDVLMVGYCRVSSENFKQSRSYKNQQKNFKLLVELTNCHEGKLFAERAKGGKEQKELRKMMMYLQKQYENNKYGTYIIVTRSSDRIFRDVDTGKEFKEFIDKINIKILFIDEILSHARQVSFDEIVKNAKERDRIAKTVGEGRKRKIYEGNAVMHQTPIGYDKNYTIIPKEAKIVRVAFRQYIKLSSLSKLAAWMNNQGFKTRKHNNFSRKSLNKILKNEAYIGTYTYGNIKKVNHHSQIVDNGLFEQVKSLLASNRKS